MAFLKLADYIIFSVTLLLSLGIGLFYSKRGSKPKTTKQYIIGDGNMSPLPVAFSLLVTFISGITMLGVPAEVYIYGMQWYISVISAFIAKLVAVYLIIPSIWKLNFTSINQYLEVRYNSHGMRLFVSVLSLLAGLNFLGSVIFVPAVTLQIMAGVPMATSIIVLVAVVLVYTIIGGFKAIIWTDVFQSVFVFGGMFAVIIKGTIEAGGVANTWSILKEKGRFNMLNFDPDPTLRQSFWSLFIGGFVFASWIPFNQSTFQRVKATPSVSAAKRMYLIATMLFLLVSTLAAVEGAVMFAYYHTKGCDPLVSKQVQNPNQLITKMVRDIFEDTPCLPGLFLAALFSASLSTMSSMFSALSAMFWEDIVKPHIRPVSEKWAIRINQLSVLLFGGLTILATFGISGIKGPISRIFDITGACTGGATLGVMLLGWFIPIANSTGALVGGLVSFLFVGWISLGKLVSSGVRVNAKLEPASTENCPWLSIPGMTNETVYESTPSNAIVNGTVETAQISFSSAPEGLDLLYSLSYKWLFPIGVCLVVVVGSVVSRLVAGKRTASPLVQTVCDSHCWFIPDRIRVKFNCGNKTPCANERQEYSERGNVFNSIQMMLEDEAEQMVALVSV